MFSLREKFIPMQSGSPGGHEIALRRDFSCSACARSLSRCNQEAQVGPRNRASAGFFMFSLREKFIPIQSGSPGGPMKSRFGAGFSCSVCEKFIQMQSEAQVGPRNRASAGFLMCLKKFIPIIRKPNGSTFFESAACCGIFPAVCEHGCLQNEFSLIFLYI